MSEEIMVRQEDVNRMVREAEERVRASMKRKIQEHGECRICFKIPKDGVQLRQCLNGHIACQKCMESMHNPECGSCRSPLTHKIRALAMEQLIEAVDLERECKYKTCEITASREALTRHEKRCGERLVPCPDFTCNQVLPFKDIIDHLKQKRARNYVDAKPYSYKIEYTMNTNIFKERDDANWHCIDILKYKGKEFLPAFTKRGGVYYAWIYLLADPEEAKKYSGTIHLGEGSQSGLIHKGEVFSIDIERKDILKAKSGLLSFTQTGMGQTLFKDLNNGVKEIAISYLIDNSATPKQLMGLNELLRMKDSAATPALPPSPKPSTSKGSESVNYRGFVSREGKTRDRESVARDRENDSDSEEGDSDSENGGSASEDGDDSATEDSDSASENCVCDPMDNCSC